MRKKPVIISSTRGTDPTISEAEARAYLEEHAAKTVERMQAAADLLLERLLVDGMEHRIQIEDIEALCATEKTPAGRSPMLMRQIIVELMLSLRRG